VRRRDNISTIVDNLDRAREVEESSQRLQAQASRFDQQARVLERRERWKKYKTYGCILLSLLIIILVVVLAVAPMTGNAPAAAPTPAPAPTVLPGGSAATPTVSAPTSG